ncbi:MAG: dehydrogenase, partial [Gammaproteobacteria bacterium]|nr:dehydrogenase [Gammaproteobacteria bacterium]
GELIVRDHDVDSSNMNHLVALAHDVFNMGLNNRWDDNQSEIRNFTSLAELVNYLERMGFKFQGEALYQMGDPTKNALLRFVAV